MRVINYWARLVSSDRDRLSNKIFGLIKNRFGVQWCRGVRKVLRRYDMLHHWADGLGAPLSGFQNSFRKLVWESEQATIRGRVSEGVGHSRWFKHIMPQTGRLRYPVYMDIVNPKHYKVMSQFRLSNCNIRVVTGAWSGEDLEHRYCQFCRFHAVDDEVHFLLECRQLENLRLRYLPADVLSSRSFVNCIKLMNSNNARILNRLCDFLTKALKLRGEVTRVAGQGAP